MYSFNPITGNPFDPESDEQSGHVLPYRVQQASMLMLTDDQELKVLVLLDTDDKVCKTCIQDLNLPVWM